MRTRLIAAQGGWEAGRFVVLAEDPTGTARTLVDFEEQKGVVLKGRWYDLTVQEQEEPGDEWENVESYGG